MAVGAKARFDDDALLALNDWSGEFRWTPDFAWRPRTRRERLGEIALPRRNDCKGTAMNAIPQCLLMPIIPLRLAEQDLRLPP